MAQGNNLISNDHVYMCILNSCQNLTWLNSVYNLPIAQVSPGARKSQPILSYAKHLFLCLKLSRNHLKNLNSEKKQLDICVRTALWLL